MVDCYQFNDCLVSVQIIYRFVQTYYQHKFCVIVKNLSTYPVAYRVYIQRLIKEKSSLGTLADFEK